MATELPYDKKTTIYNSFKIPEVAFFNDTYRDVVGGSNFGGSKGYALGNLALKNGFQFSLMGSIIDHFEYKARFENANQSINYVECHDNKTIFDKIDDYCGKDVELSEKLRILNLINGTIALSIGVPFYHAGQEIGLTKFQVDNTYNKGDKYNMFRWNLLDERYENYLYFKSLLDYRRNVVKNKEYAKDCVIKNTGFKEFNNDSFAFLINNVEVEENRIEEYLVAFNVTNENKYNDLGDYYKAIIGVGGQLKNSDIYTRNIILEDKCLNCFYKRK